MRAAKSKKFPSASRRQISRYNVGKSIELASVLPLPLIQDLNVTISSALPLALEYRCNLGRSHRVVLAELLRAPTKNPVLEYCSREEITGIPNLEILDRVSRKGRLFGTIRYP